MEEWGILKYWCYVLHDRDAKYARSLRALFHLDASQSTVPWAM